MFPSRPRIRMVDEDTQQGYRRSSYRQRRRRFNGNAGKQALRKVNRLEKELAANVTLKALTTTANAVTLAANTAGETSLVVMQRGDTNFIREGDKISLHSLAWKGSLVLDAAETNGSAVRLVVVYDRRPAGGQVNYESVFNAQTAEAIMNTVSFLGENRGRFKILSDNMYSLSPNGQEMVMFKGYCDLKNLPVIYDANDGDITDVQVGNLFLAYISRNNASNIVLNGYWRLRFTDTN